MYARNAASKELDARVVEGSRRCTNCGRAKPIATHFTWLPSAARHHSWCKQCVRIAKGLSSEDPDVRAARAAYLAGPRRKALNRDYRERHREEHRRSNARYAATPRGRIVRRIGTARYRLRCATTDEQRSIAQACIDRHVAALAALDALESEDETWAKAD